MRADPAVTLRLEVQGLAVARGGIRVLEGIDFALTSGQALILRGPNGIGKTTVLRTIAGLQPPLAGRVVMPVDGAAYAAHADGLKPTLTVAENLGFWARIFGQSSIQTALARMNLHELATRPAHMLSAGQKRRLGLARLLVTGRPIWLLDEPTVSLDAGSVALFAQILRDHLGAGGMALIATHIDLGLDGAATLDLTPFRANLRRPIETSGAFDEAFI